MERNKYIDAILNKKQGGNYDCAVIFSGGKDSTYLLYLFKKVYKKNVIAITVDNGFEFESTFDHGRKITDRLGVPYHIISPGKENFRLFFESAIKEPELFIDVKRLNHLCLICSKLLWGIVASYASRNNIPFVIGGYDPAQLYDIDEINEFTNGIKEKTDKLFLAKLKGL